MTSPQIIARFRVAEQDFTRQRGFSFAMLAVLIVRGHKLSMQNALNKFFRSIGQVWQVPTSSAYSQARQKLKPELFLYLNQVVCQDFYGLPGQAEQVRRWRGHRLWGLDASIMSNEDIFTACSWMARRCLDASIMSNEETYFDRLKNSFEVERFSGLSVSSIEQDCCGMIFLTTLESVLAKPAQAALAHESRARETKHVAQVNCVVSYVAVLDRVVELLCDHQANKAELLAELQHLFQTNPTRQRVGRKSERPKRGYARKLWSYRYLKRVIA